MNVIQLTPVTPKKAKAPTKADLIARISSLEELLGNNAPKQLGNFTKTLTEQIKIQLTKFEQPIFFVEGKECSSLYAITEALGWDYTASKWVKLRDFAGFVDIGWDTKSHCIKADTQDGYMHLPKRGKFETKVVPIADVERLFTECWPRAGKTVIAKFKKHHNIQ